MTTSRLHTVLLCASALTSFGALHSAPAFAAEAAAADATATEEMAGEITVTARKRDETIVDVPLAITVVSAAKLEKLDIRSTGDLANYVPGLQFSDYTPGYARNDRGGTRPLIFRGLNVGTGGSVSAAGGMFLDGAAVVGNEIPGGMDIGAVEVLRGPQSVYFGRSTMTGAVSYRTKAIPDSWGAEVAVTLAERERKDFEASVAGPVIPGFLKVRLTGLWEDSGGYVTNTYDGSKLGDRSRKSISLSTEITPTDTITVKTYINYFRDEDGPAATAFLTSSLNNCKFPGAIRTTFCGAIPNRSNSINYLNTNIPTVGKDFIFASPLINSTGFKKQLGLQREVVNSHVVGDWNVSDYLTVQSITGYHVNTTLQAADGKGRAPVAADLNQLYFYTITNKSRDFSQELRLSSDSDRAFSWTLGGNYINAYDKTNALLYYLRPSTTGNTTIPQTIGTQLAKTYGAFAGAYLKVFDERLTFSAEGRYQIDKRGTFNTNAFTGAQVGSRLAKTFRSFNPRGAIDFDIGGGRKVYASYASGTRPGGFNASLLQAIARVGTAGVQEAFGVSDASFKEEKLAIGEFGVKGAFDGGKGYFDINLYYGKLTDQQVGASAILFCRIQPSCSPTLAFGAQDAFSTTATANAGAAEVYGIEWQGNYTFMRGLSLATTFAWNHTERTKFDSFSSIAQFGTRTLDGVKFANTPEISGSAVLSYERPITDEWNFFSTASGYYRGRQYVDAFNAAYIKGRTQVDLRIGVDNKTYTIEGYVTNLLNNQGYTGGSIAPNFDDITYHGFFGAWAVPQTFGARLRVKI